MRNLSLEFVKFSLVGVVNTAHHYWWYIILKQNLAYATSNVIAFLISMIGSFYINSCFTFKVRPTIQRLVHFPFVYTPQLAASYVVPFVTVNVLHLPDIYVPIITTAVAMPITYFLSRHILKG